MKLSAPGGYSVHYFDQIDSTNAECHRLAKAGAAMPLWVVAGQQSSGRGRRGRAWVSEPGNLFASLLLKPDCPAGRAAELSFVAALALFRALTRVEDSEGRLTLKWPNDVLLDGCKCAGILLEAQVGGAHLDWAVIGIGVNVAHAPEVAENQTISLAEAFGPVVDVAGLFADLAGGMARELEAWQAHGFDKVRRDWVAHSVALGTSLALRANGTDRADDVRGRFAGLDASGGLMLEDSGGEVQTVFAGDIVNLAGAEEAVS